MALRWLLAVLTVVTVLALYANEQGRTRWLPVDGRTPGQLLKAVDDQPDGGSSAAHMLKMPGEGVAMECELKAGFQWPYCELQIDLGRAGIDFTQFSHLRFGLEAEGPTTDGQPPQVRVFLLGRRVGQGLPVPPGGYKPHEVVWSATRAASAVQLRPDQFAVSSWWMREHPERIEEIGPKLDQVHVLSIGTGGNAAPGLHRIRLYYAELVGTWMPVGTLRLGLLLLWMVSLLVYLALDARAAHRRLRRHTDDLEQRVERDALTQLANRTGVERFIEELRRQGDNSYPVSIVFLDIDRFKDINDAHGHAVGDAVLVQFAQALRQHLPRGDLVARWGGEEFLILMRQTTAAEATNAAQRLRDRLAAEAWPEGLHITASWGVAEATTPAEMADCLQAADAAMYRAKRDGRDRVETRF